MKKIGIFFILVVTLTIFYSSHSFGQGTNCGDADPFCTGTGDYTFPAATDEESLGSVGCLGSTPNPAWYYMQIGSTGPLNIHMSSGGDVDFICWGPFTSLAAACATDLMSNPGVDCSYSTAAQEDCTIPNAVSGQVYILLITNYADIETNISFNQTTGTGSTDCGIMTPPAIGDTVCEGETATLHTTAVSGASYEWQGPYGYDVTTTSNSVSINTGGTNPFMTNPVTHLLAGTYVFNMTITSSTGSVGSQVPCTLFVASKPTLNVTTDSICLGETAVLSASGATNYHWNTNETTAIITPSPIVTTPYKVTGTSLFGCKDSANTQVVVTPNPIITVTPSSVCSGVQATAFASDAVSYVWSDGGLTTNTFEPVVTSQQIYTVTVSNAQGCSSTATLTANPNPTVTATASEICAGDASTVAASGADTYNWSTSQSGSVISVSPMSTMDVSVTGTNEFGCTGNGSTTIVVHPVPVANFNPSTTTVTIDDGEITFNDLSTDASIWNYNFGETINPSNTSTEQNPTHKYLSVGYFQVWLVASNEFGCTNSTYRRVQVEAPYFFYVPNAFTPDHNDKNETFCAYGKGVDRANYSMELYDRWGVLVFKTYSLDDCWDGNINGERAPIDTYVYKITLKDMEGKHHDYMGNFLLMR